MLLRTLEPINRGETEVSVSWDSLMGLKLMSLDKESQPQADGPSAVEAYETDMYSSLPAFHSAKENSYQMIGHITTKSPHIRPSPDMMHCRVTMHPASLSMRHCTPLLRIQHKCHCSCLG